MSNSQGVAQQVMTVLDATLRIPVGALEQVVQEAHESDSKQVGDPPERFPITRQALRMFWHFRCNLESVEVKAAHD